MKLYFSPGACSLAPHIALCEAELAFTLDRVDLRAKKLVQSGDDYRKVNPKGSVPALELGDGQVLTEAAVILQYIADRKPAAKLAPPAGTIERYRLQEALNYIATELHKNIAPFFNPRTPEEWKAVLRDILAARFDFVAGRLERGPFALGGYSVADAYAYVILRWTRIHAIDLGRWPAIQAYMGRVEARPAAQAALKAEGLIQ